MIRPRKFVATLALLSMCPCAELWAAASPTEPDKNAQLAARLSAAQSEVPRRIQTASGGQRLVAVKLTTGATLRGRVREIADDHFVLLLARTATPAAIAFDQVEKVSSGSTKTKQIVADVSVAAAVAMLVIFYKRATRWPTGIGSVVGCDYCK